MKTLTDLVHTYSIIAIDKEAGVMGGAVQSHYFSVGGTVIWAEPGSGVIATQAMVNMEYGPAGLALLKAGMDARAVITELTGGDESSEIRQAAALDCRGNTAAFTGSKTIREAGHFAGSGFSVQANMMLKNTVPDAMVRAFTQTDGELSGRLMAALNAAEAEGGDIRGRQSAALLLVSVEDQGKVRDNIIADLRVEDHPEPLIELGRLLDIHRAYQYADRGDLAVEDGDFSAAMREYKKAEALLPNSAELRFWKGVSLLNNLRFKEAEKVFSAVFDVDDNWRELLCRLPDAGVVKPGVGIIEFINKINNGE